MPDKYVRPSREAMRAILIDDDCWDDGYGMPMLLEDVAIDRILALWPGRTERAVAEAAWQEAFAAARAWRLGSDPIPENPYRAKGATND